MKEYEIKKIIQTGDRLSVTIPKKSDFKVGEYVKISKLIFKEDNGNETTNNN